MKIRIENINKTYYLPSGESFPVLKDINISINKGSFVMILGESGCGKSTLLNIIGGLLEPTSGNVLVNDTKVIKPHPSVSLLFQQPSLLPWLNVEDNITFGCKIRGDTENLYDRVQHFIEMIGLCGFEKSYPSELSVGMAYRVSLARALIGHPDILLLDEPFVSLDTFTKTHLQEELIKIWIKEKFTAIFVTHDIDESIIMGNKVVLLGGRPCSVKDIIDINYVYPRKITDRTLFLTRTYIMMKFKKTIQDNRNNC